MTQQTEKRCPRCQKTKPVSAWWKDKTHYDGLDSKCSSCRKKANKNYAATEKGIAFFRAKGQRDRRNGKRQRERWYADGMEKWIAHNISKALMLPELRCAVCGVPNYVLQEYARKNRPCPSFIGGTRRMTGGRINHDLPHIEDNIRGECPKCNSLRGHDRRDEDEVREIMADRWGLEYPSYPEWLILPERLRAHGKGAAGIRISFV